MITSPTTHQSPTRETSRWNGHIPQGPQSHAQLPEDAEIIANLWSLMDDQGFIYSLRIALYVAGGSETDKLELLRSRAYLDHLVARPFPIPDRYGTAFIEPDGSETKFAAIHHDSGIMIGGLDQLFFDGVDQMQSELPTQTGLSIPQSPLTKLIALVERNGEVVPVDSLG